MLSKQKSIFLLSSYLQPHTVCKFKSMSDVAPNSQVKVFAQLLLQNAVDVLSKLDVHSKSQSFIEVARLIHERSRAVLIHSFRMLRLDNKRMCSLPVHDAQVSTERCYNLLFSL